LKEARKVLQKSVSQHVLDKKWLTLASYLSNRPRPIFDKLNRHNTSLQCPNVTIFQLVDKVSGFIKNILWKNLCESDSIEIYQHE
jgi:hypothetical protein